MKKVNIGKTSAFDGISDKLFRIGKDKQCRELKEINPNKFCKVCEKKNKFCFLNQNIGHSHKAIYT